MDFIHLTGQARDFVHTEQLTRFALNSSVRVGTSRKIPGLTQAFPRGVRGDRAWFLKPRRYTKMRSSYHLGQTEHEHIAFSAQLLLMGSGTAGQTSQSNDSTMTQATGYFEIG